MSAVSILHIDHKNDFSRVAHKDSFKSLIIQTIADLDLAVLFTCPVTYTYIAKGKKRYKKKYQLTGKATFVMTDDTFYLFSQKQKVIHKIAYSDTIQLMRDNACYLILVRVFFCC